MTTYTITIPDLIIELVGSRKVRVATEDAVREVFEEWAKPELVKRIRVTRPREGGDD